MTDHFRMGEDVISSGSDSSDFGACDREDMYSGEMPSKATVDFSKEKQEQEEMERRKQQFRHKSQSYTPSPDKKVK